MLIKSQGIKKIGCLSHFLEELPIFQDQQTRGNLIIGWGRKPSYFRAKKYAQKYNQSCVCLEDGFIRSMGLGKQGYTPLSLVVDHTGIYFDASHPSDLENLIIQSENQEQLQRAKAAIKIIIKYKITKYNQKFDVIPLGKFTKKKNILIVDQTYGDQSIAYAGATAQSFKQMLKQARLDHPEAQLWVKTHPDVRAGKAKGHFDQQDFLHHDIQLITEQYNPLALCQYMDEVYVVSSHLGFEALLLNKPVHCFGVPWYAGWGLTQDQHAPIAILNQRRQINRSLEHLFACAYFDYARYVSPVTQQRCELEDLLALLIPNIQFQQQLAQQSSVAYGFSRWKRQFLSDYLNFPNFKLTFKQWLKPQKEQMIFAWGKKALLLKAKGYQQVWTVEDGFVRSIGLGAKLIRPCSLVFDDVGIYYDATRPSRLEILLNDFVVDHSQTQRAKNLQMTLIQEQLSKYNVGMDLTEKPDGLAVKDQRKLLVIGQVEDDLSVQLGGVDIKTNLALLQQVRQTHPDAYIIYKPHPDVEAGLRKGKLAQHIVLQYADDIESDMNIVALFKCIDEVHTISSLTGFEALLREIPVHCYGLPFYAGWGLTHDRFSCQRRNRTLSVLELIYITLIEYPVYNLPQTAHMQLALTCPEHVIQDMILRKGCKNDQKKYWLSGVFTYMRRFKVRSQG